MGNGNSLVARRRGVQAPTQQTQRVAAQAPTPQNTPVNQSGVKTLAGMDDAQLAALYNASKTIDMPNQLADASDATQRFVFAAGLNAKPMVLDQNEFQQYMRDNNLTSSDLLSRSFNGTSYTNASGTSVKLTDQDVADMLMYSRLNYIGGKWGGQALGAGTYFDHTSGRPTGYGSRTVVAVLNPKTARAINYNTLTSKARAFDASHPQFARATGGLSYNNTSVYATVMGYNVVTSGGGYTCVIDRSALVYRKD